MKTAARWAQYIFLFCLTSALLQGATQFGPEQLKEKSEQVSSALRECWKQADDKKLAGVVLDAFGAIQKTAQHAFQLRDECQQLHQKYEQLLQEKDQLSNAHEDKADMAEMVEDLSRQVRELRIDEEKAIKERDEARAQVKRLEQAQAMLEHDLSAPPQPRAATHEKPRPASRLEAFFKGMLPVPGTQTLVV